MKIVSNWRRVLRFSLQFWTNVLAALFGAAEFALPYIREIYPVPDRLFLVLSIITIFASNMLRFVVQQKVSDHGE